MKSLFHSLQQPFPDRGSHNRSLLSLAGVGLFVTLFLWVLRPFGLGDVPEGLFWICLGFGGVTLVFGWMYDALFRFVLRIRTDLPSWTLGKWILYTTTLIVWIAVGNYLYMNFVLGFTGVDASFLLQMILNTAVVGIFPILFSGLMIQLRAARGFSQSATELQPQVSAHHNTAPVMVELASASEEVIEIPSSAVCYIEAMQNYVCVFHIRDGALKKEILRETVANMEARFADSGIIRCHRSYLVNLDRITDVSGNAQGLKLKLENVPDFTVPVSRKYIPELRKLL